MYATRYVDRVLRTGRRLAQPVREVALDLLAITRARIELPHQPAGARTQPARHVLPVGVGQLSHRAIEFELFDGPQREHLLALESRSGPVTDHRRAIVLRRHQRP